MQKVLRKQSIWVAAVAMACSTLVQAAPAGKASSYYTNISLKSCAKLPPRAPAEGGGMRCKGPAGYKS